MIGILARTSGAAALRRALPTYAGLFVIVVILFAGNGVRSRDVVGLATASPPTRVILLGAWLLLALPAARAVLTEPSSFLIRTWPIARAPMLGVLTGLLALVEAPWTLLWLAGGGILAGAAATALALGGHGLLLGRPRRATEIAAAACWIAAVAALSRPWLALLAALPALVLGPRRAFLDAPERIGVRRTVRLVSRGRFAVLALAQAHLAMMLRGQRPALARAVWFAGGGALAAGLAVTNNHVTDPARASSIWRTAALLADGWAALGLTGGVQRATRGSAWLVAVCGVREPASRAGASLALIVVAVALAGVAGAALGTFAMPGAALALAGAGAAAAAAGASGAAACARWALRGDGGDSARLLTSAIAGGAALAPAAYWLPGAALWAIAGALLLVPAAAAPRDRRRAGSATLAGEG